MRIERLNSNKIKIFLTTDDLSERGLTKEDIWKDSLKWHQLFHDMLQEASDEYGVNIEGSVAVEIFSMHAQGMIMIVTVEEEEDSLNEGFIDMEVTEKDHEGMLFEFYDIEEVIQLANRLKLLNISGASLYSMNNRYFLSFYGEPMDNMQDSMALVAEYGNASLESIHRLEDYGKIIIKDCAIETLVRHFPA